MIVSQLRVVPRLVQGIPALLKELSLKRLLFAAFPFITYLIVFAFYLEIREFFNLNALSPPNYSILSTIEYRLFFCHPHRLLSYFANPFFDCLAAIPYLVHFPLPFLFAIYLAFTPKKRPALYPYLWCVGWVNLIGVAFEITFPCAPPWFTDSAVLDEHGQIVYEAANEAGFKRLDILTGFKVFHNIYAQSPMKYGAFPSLHVAIPVVVLLNHPWFGTKFGVMHVVAITLAALYSTHHYLIDALGGIFLAVCVRMLMWKVWSPFPELEAVNREAEDGLSNSYAPEQNETPESIV